MTTFSLSELDLEIWKVLPGFPVYEVSSLGRVRRVGGQPRRITYNAKGYGQLALTDGPVRLQASVHVLVALAFHGPKPTEQHEAAHWNGNPSDNRVFNIRWATKKENAADRNRHGNTARGDGNGATKLADEKIELIFADRAAGLSQYALADKYGISQAQIWNILHKKQRVYPYRAGAIQPCA